MSAHLVSRRDVSYWFADQSSVSILLPFNAVRPRKTTKNDVKSPQQRCTFPGRISSLDLILNLCVLIQIVAVFVKKTVRSIHPCNLPSLLLFPVCLIADCNSVSCAVRLERKVIGFTARNAQRCLPSRFETTTAVAPLMVECTVLAEGDSVCVEVEPHIDDVTDAVPVAKATHDVLQSVKISPRVAHVADFGRVYGARGLRCGNDAEGYLASVPVVAVATSLVNTKFHLVDAYNQPRHDSA